MRLWLALLATWTFAGWAHGQGSPTVTVDCGPKGSFVDPVRRLPEGTLVTPFLLQRIGWTVRLHSESAFVAVEGREFELDVMAFDGRPYVRLEDAAQGARLDFAWDEKGETLSILGLVDRVRVVDGRLSVLTTFPATARAFRVPAPDRLVIDVSGTRLREGAGEGLPANARVSQLSPTVTRIVWESPEVAQMEVPGFEPGTRFELDVPGRAAPARPLLTVGRPVEREARDGAVSFFVPVTGAGSPRPSAVFLNPTTIQVSLPGSTSDQTGERPEPSPLVVSTSVAADHQDVTTIVWSLERPLAFQLSPTQGGFALTLRRPPFQGGLGGKVVVVDAGHGGRDPGAVSGGVQEKAQTLATSRAIAAALARRGASVVMTRDDDVFVPLAERAAIAARSRAHAFVSVHFNSNHIADSRSGTIVFYHQQDQMDMLLAECIRQELAKVSGLPDLGAWSDRRIYQTGFAVLRGTPMPSVLLELGFINHATDRGRMQETQFREAVGEAVAKGMEAFFGR